MLNVTTLNDWYPPHGVYDPPKIGDNVLISSHCNLMPGAIVESDSFIPAHTIVKGVWKSNMKAYKFMVRTMCKKRGVAFDG